MNESLIRYLKNYESELDNITINLTDCDGLDDAVIVNLNGYIDTYNSVIFLKQIHEVISHYHIVIFNFEGVSYLSSTGIGIFTECYKDLKMKGGNMVIVHMADKIYEVFSLLGFANFFQITRTIDDAVKLVTKKPDVVKSCFPTVITCPSCDNRLNAKKSGKFRCPKCKCIIAISNTANVSIG